MKTSASSKKFFSPRAVNLLLLDMGVNLLLLTFGQKVLDISDLAGFNSHRADVTNEIHTRCHSRAKVDPNPAVMFPFES
jgi:hypothetical protein